MSTTFDAVGADERKNRGITTTTRPPSTEGAPPVHPRPLRSRTFDDIACLLGSFAGSLGFTFVIYEFLLPFSSWVGFFVLWYVAFVGVYIGTTALSNPGIVVRERLASAIVQGGAALTGFLLASAIIFTFARGYHAIVHINFWHEDMTAVGPNDPLNRGGVWHAMYGTLVEIGIAVAITVPLGIGTAVYMSEIGGKFSRVVRTVVEAMTALPSIVAGLFIYTVVIHYLYTGKSGMPAALAISVMILPIIARAADVVLRVVPAGLREASLALGASRWQTVWRVVLPTVRPGLATAVILGIARGIGETSPVLLTSQATTFFESNPFNGQPMNSMPLFIYQAWKSQEPRAIDRAFGAACVLLILVFSLFVITRLIARQKVR